jgi:protein TonB
MKGTFGVFVENTALCLHELFNSVHRLMVSHERLPTVTEDGMSSANYTKKGDMKPGMLSRGGPALAVIGIHVAIIYVLAVSMGVIDVPKYAAPLEAVMIQDTQESKPEPVPMVKPDIDVQQPVDQPLPEVAVDEPIAPPAENPMEASQTAIAATSAGAPAQDLKTASRVEPTYPPVSRRAGEEGVVRLKVLVDEKGRPKDVQIAQSSGFPRLDEAAKQAVSRWKFVAATNGSSAVQAWTQVAVNFKLTTGSAG